MACRSSILSAGCASLVVAGAAVAGPFNDALTGQVFYSGGSLAVSPDNPVASIKVYATMAEPWLLFAGIESHITDMGSGQLTFIDEGELAKHHSAWTFISPTGPGSFGFIVGQLGTIGGLPFVYSNPIHILTLEWTTTDFTPRTELLTTDTLQFAVYTKNTGASRNGTPIELALPISVIPSPATAGLALGVITLHSRRRRQ